MNHAASFLGLGAPELMFLLGFIVVFALVICTIQGIRKGYRKEPSEDE